VSFNTYVDGVLRAVREEHPAFKDMRVSARTREYISGLVAEMIERLGRQGQILVQDLMKVRTIDAEHILIVVKQLMTDRGVAPADVADIQDHVAKKLECYKVHLEGEHARREESRDDAKKAELELAKLRKKAEQTVRQKELAAKRSVEAVARAALLGQALEALGPQVEAAAAAAAKAAEAKAAAEAEAAAAAEADGLARVKTFRHSAAAWEASHEQCLARHRQACLTGTPESIKAEADAVTKAKQAALYWSGEATAADRAQRGLEARAAAAAKAAAAARAAALAAAAAAAPPEALRPDNVGGASLGDTLDGFLDDLLA
jgi:hypothetical protein